MSDMNAINLSNPAFCGRRESKKVQEGREEIDRLEVKKSIPEAIKEKISQPVKDEFNKAYGGEEATPALVADFVADNALKIGVGVLGGALFFAKSRKVTNGLTRALQDSFSELKNNAPAGKKAKIVSGSVGAIKDALNKVKNANLDAANEARKAAQIGGEDVGIIKKLQNSVLRPAGESTKFANGSKLGVVIDTVSGGISKAAKKVGINFDKDACSKTVKKGFENVGITDGHSLVDTAVAGAAATTLGTSANGIAADVTEKDNTQLAREAKVQKFERTLDTIQKLADTADILIG